MKKKKKVVCNIPIKGEHCLNHCFHGVPHEKETGKDACHLNYEFCNAHKNRKITKVICEEIDE